MPSARNRPDAHAMAGPRRRGVDHRNVGCGRSHQAPNGSRVQHLASLRMNTSGRLKRLLCSFTWHQGLLEASKTGPRAATPHCVLVCHENPLRSASTESGPQVPIVAVIGPIMRDVARAFVEWPVPHERGL